MHQFESFGKIPRLSREVIITEKLDGTNAQILITDAGDFLVGSRNRFITPDNDNYGFARWCAEHREELLQLGPGRHFGEWWGKGIQRGYGLGEKRFSLFNVTRWGDDTVRPSCCAVVPLLYQGSFDTEKIKSVLWGLQAFGSKAAPGFMDPEGIVIFHTASRQLYKKTLQDDDVPKSLATA